MFINKWPNIIRVLVSGRLENKAGVSNKCRANKPRKEQQRREGDRERERVSRVDYGA